MSETCSKEGEGDLLFRSEQSFSIDNMLINAAFNTHILKHIHIFPLMGTNCYFPNQILNMHNIYSQIGWAWNSIAQHQRIMLYDWRNDNVY